MLKNTNISDFWKKASVLFLLIMMYRIGAHIPVPYENISLIITKINQENTNIITQTLNMFSGGAFKNFSILMFGIAPFITASIIIQTSTLFVKKYKDIKNEGAKGIITLNNHIKKLTIGIIFFQTFPVLMMIKSQEISLGMSINEATIIKDFIFDFILYFCSFASGTMFLVWLSEKITALNIGAGTSILILTAIISSLPDTIDNISLSLSGSSIHIFFIVVMLLLAFVITSLFETSVRKIPILSSNITDSSKNYITLKINITTIMPIIFVTMIFAFFHYINESINKIFDFNFIFAFKDVFGDYEIYYVLLFSIAIYIISFLYVKTQINTNEMSKNLKSSGVYIKGIKAGKNTENYLNYKIKLLTFISSTYITVVCLIPEFINSTYGIYLHLGGTTIIIMVSVSKDILESYNNDKFEEKYKNISSNIHKHVKRG